MRRECKLWVKVDDSFLPEWVLGGVSSGTLMLQDRGATDRRHVGRVGCTASTQGSIPASPHLVQNPGKIDYIPSFVTLKWSGYCCIGNIKTPRSVLTGICTLSIAYSIVPPLPCPRSLIYTSKLKGTKMKVAH